MGGGVADGHEQPEDGGRNPGGAAQLLPGGGVQCGGGRDRGAGKYRGPPGGSRGCKSQGGSGSLSFLVITLLCLNTLVNVTCVKGENE